MNFTLFSNYKSFVSRMHRKKATPMYLTNYKILTDREIGLKPRNGYTENLAKKIYTSLDACEPGRSVSKYCGNEGGIFNLEFNMDGHTLAAACEDKSILLFDAANQKPYKTIKHAHDGCVNCIRYLDYFTFATCSDDNTIRLWDVRNLDSSMRILYGHTNWVKNIEYLENEHILVSSAFDGNILTWDLTDSTEHNVMYNSLYVMSDLMRTKITNDGTKMVLSSTNGYMMIIHDLNLETLNKDIGFFKPNLYRYLQQNDTSYPSAAIFSFLFSQERKRNRIELIDDFPNQPKVISSLQLHPMGWCAVSRNINGQENEEWTAVHDIQSRPFAEYADAYKITADIASDVHFDESTITSGRWLSLLSQINQGFFRPQPSGSNIHPLEHLTVATEILDPSVVQNGDEHECLKFKNRIFLNVPRLTNYIQEKNAGKGFIKEQCFSHDGRIICSPYGRGLRLFAFNEQIQELSYCIPNYPAKLFTMAELIDYHSDCVVSCKFSPTHYQLVSGCLSGEIVWYKPVF